jgi:oligoendopeptidase F
MDNAIGAEQTRWDLSTFYTKIDDPQIDKDIADLVARQKKFQEDYRGKLAEKLGGAITDCATLSSLSDKIFVYLFLQQSLNVTNAVVKAKIAEAEQKIAASSGEYMTFFDIELVALDDTILEKWYANDPAVKKHRPWIDHARIFKPHLLSEPVEAALVKRSPFGLGAWSEFFDEYEAELRFDYGGETKTLVEMLDILTHSKDEKERAETLRIVNAGLGGMFAKYAAQTLYVVAGKAAVERRERKYRHPMEPQNKSNRIPDAAVDALHRTVLKEGVALAKRYYQLKAKLLGIKMLAWSDRNAPIPLADTTIVPFDQGMSLVLEAYQSFSPTLASIVRDSIKERRIDAPATKGKRGGAFNYSTVLPGNSAASFTFLNYLGSSRDVMTLAHELGHGVHGILAGKAQGPLMQQAPIAYAETASVFGEMISFNFLKDRLKKNNDQKALLALTMGKIDDAMNTVVRQIGFSNFERRLHGMDAAYEKWDEPKKFSAEELNAIWIKTLKEIYGEEGEVFTYKNVEHLWAYVSHFHRPFYVYGYAFGELLTQSLYAQRENLGDRFEPLYLDLLRSGATKNVSELLAPFNLDPANETFWSNGLRVGLQRLIEEAEMLSTMVKSS